MPDTAPDPVEALITAWINWETNPNWRATVIAKEEALHALGLPLIETHDHMATWRRAEYSVPDAVQSLWNDHHKPSWEEAA